jgi:hypothetical protein
MKPWLKTTQLTERLPLKQDPKHDRLEEFIG